VASAESGYCADDSGDSRGCHLYQETLGPRLGPRDSNRRLDLVLCRAADGGAIGVTFSAGPRSLFRRGAATNTQNAGATRCPHIFDRVRPLPSNLVKSLEKIRNGGSERRETCQLLKAAIAMREQLTSYSQDIH